MREHILLGISFENLLTFPSVFLSKLLKNRILAHVLPLQDQVSFGMQGVPGKPGARLLPQPVDDPYFTPRLLVLF